MNIYLPASSDFGGVSDDDYSATDFAVPVGMVPVHVMRGCTVSMPKFESSGVVVALTAWSDLDGQEHLQDLMMETADSIVANARAKLKSLREKDVPVPEIVDVSGNFIMSVTYSLTLNMGDYDFEKFSYSLSAVGESTKELYEDLSHSLSKKMNDARKRVRSKLSL